jgi:type III secretory pathway component EscT
MPSILGTVAEAFARSGVDLGALGLAWARVTPTVVLVPAFGLRALPAPARAILGLAFAASIVPALAPVAHADAPWALLALTELVRGLPVAIAAAVPLWAATMAGGVIDALRASQYTASAPAVSGEATPFGVPLGILASALFLGTGGPARIVAALATRPFPTDAVRAAAADLVAGIALAVSLGGPLLGAAVILEIALALVARAASPAQVQALVAPLRSLGILVVTAIVLERFAALLGRSVVASP